MVKVKVCGITNLEDALKSVELGADLLGFNFYPPSPRYITPEKARGILADLPAAVGNVALFVNEPKEKVREVIGYGLLADGGQSFYGLQFHGEESQDYCRGWVLKNFPRIFISWIPGLPAMAAQVLLFPGAGSKD